MATALHSRPEKGGPPVQGSAIRSQRARRAAEGGEDFGVAKFLRAVVNKDFRSLPGRVEKAALSENSGTLGGYAVPQEFNLALMSTVEEKSFIRPRAQVIPMGSLETYCPGLSETNTTTAGTSPFFGGYLLSWGEGQDGQTLTESEPAFDQLVLHARDLIGYVTLSNQFLQDVGPDGEARLLETFAAAAAFYEQYAFLRGIGADGNQPIGMVNCPAALTVNRSSVSNITDADVSQMTGLLLPYSWNRSIWACSPTALKRLCYLDAFVVNPNPLSVEIDYCAGSLFTRPLFVTEALPALGTKGDLVFFDPFLYVIGDRQETLVDASPHTLFRTNQTVFRVWRRVDGKPFLSKAVTLADGSSQASCVVVLN